MIEVHMKAMMEIKFSDLVSGGYEVTHIKCKRASMLAAQEGKYLCVILDESEVRVDPKKAKIHDVRISMAPMQFAHVAIIRTRDGTEYVLKDVRPTF